MADARQGQLNSPPPVVCRVLRITGQVQGVGFRPFVLRLAEQLGIKGTVCNDLSGVTVRSFGTAHRLDAFQTRLKTDAPQLARIKSVDLQSEDDTGACPDEFQIVASTREREQRGHITVDSAICAACLNELFDPSNRRHRHGLINCTNCGPRYSIVKDLPYDRPRTTMAAFDMCPLCKTEYQTPSDRRFHAQPTCCPNCGPQVQLIDTSGRVSTDTPFQTAAEHIANGQIIAMKGLGGYHLVVRADREESVQRLRKLKHRDHKPFAVMFRTIEDATRYVALSDAGRKLLQAIESPIVLTRTQPDTLAVNRPLARSIAPGSHRLGIMLPNTPMQYILAAEPALDQVPLVMTSANLSDDPLIKDDEAATHDLARMCDAFLLHNRPIERAVDDSVIADTPRGLIPFRRARGYVPQPTELPIPVEQPGLCVGGELKNAIAIARDDSAILSQHIGDLSYSLAYERFTKTIEDWERLFEIAPQWIACDRHPQYLSRRFAERFARQRNIPCHSIQHHHAHFAAVAAEHGRTDTLIGVICDGVGYGDDGTAWGGEIFVGDLSRFDHAAQLRPLRLPGGDAAAKETGRCAAAWLFDLLGTDAVDHPISHRILPDNDRRATVFSMLKHDLACPPSSGMGRLFDAAAALLGLCDVNHYEAMAGLTLESAAHRTTCHVSLVPLQCQQITDEAKNGPSRLLDTRPLLADLLDHFQRGASVESLAWGFHDAIAAGLQAVTEEIAESTDIRTVALSGGVFCNALLTDLLANRLERAGLEVLVHHRVPPNDGGLAYGQAAIVAARLASE